MCLFRGKVVMGRVGELDVVFPDMCQGTYLFLQYMLDGYLALGPNQMLLVFVITGILSVTTTSQNIRTKSKRLLY